MNENDGPHRQLARYVKDVGEMYVENIEAVVIYRQDRFGRGGDHTSFLDQNFTSVRLTAMHEDFTQQHQDVRVEDGVQYGDLEEFLDYDYIQKVAALNLAALSSLALSPPPPQTVTIDTTTLDNFTTLRWLPPADMTQVAGFVVLYRASNECCWNHKRFFFPSSPAVVPLSKDNYLFAVQSIDASLSHPSLPVPAT